MEMVKVYKTNVNEHSRAKLIMEAIRKKLPGSDPSFDLEDCDKVLRVECQAGNINESEIRGILKNYGYQIESLL
jgi:hypothetical protein